MNCDPGDIQPVESNQKLRNLVCLGSFVIVFIHNIMRNSILKCTRLSVLSCEMAGLFQLMKQSTQRLTTELDIFLWRQICEQKDPNKTVDAEHKAVVPQLNFKVDGKLIWPWKALFCTTCQVQDMIKALFIMSILTHVLKLEKKHSDNDSILKKILWGIIVGL